MTALLPCYFFFQEITTNKPYKRDVRLTTQCFHVVIRNKQQKQSVTYISQTCNYPSAFLAVCTPAIIESLLPQCLQPHRCLPCRSQSRLLSDICFSQPSPQSSSKFLPFTVQGAFLQPLSDEKLRIAGLVLLSEVDVTFYVLEDQCHHLCDLKCFTTGSRPSVRRQKRRCLSWCIFPQKLCFPRWISLVGLCFLSIITVLTEWSSWAAVCRVGTLGAAYSQH